MPCTITKADLGTPFADVDDTLADEVIACAIEIVLGVGDVNQAKWIACGLDPCKAAALLAQHILTTIPEDAGGAANLALVQSERVGDVSTAYKGATSTDKSFQGSTWGQLYAMQLGNYEQCAARRSTLPRAYGGNPGGCGCL